MHSEPCMNWLTGESFPCKLAVAPLLKSCNKRAMVLQHLILSYKNIVYWDILNTLLHPKLAVPLNDK